MSQSLLRRSLAPKSAKIGLGAMVLMICLAVFGPWLAPYSPTEMIGLPYDGPSANLLFGADALGRDVLSRFLHGGFSLIWMSMAAAGLAICLGALLGLAAAFHGGFVDNVIMRMIDIKMAFPTTVFALLLVTVFGPAPGLLVFIVGISQTPGVARVLRGAALSVVHQEYVQYARAIGTSGLRIITSDVMPNVASTLLAELGLRLMWAITALAGLSFLGFGIQPPQADWGLMINENRNALTIQVWAVLVPIAGIAIFTIGGNLFAEGVARAVARTEGEGR